LGRFLVTAAWLPAAALLAVADPGLAPIPDTDGDGMPDTAQTLEQLGCDDCQGRAWSLKPARIRVP